jgi:SHS2 domain-containing protein
MEKPAPAPEWRHFDHAADMGICGSGPSLAEAFEQAALGLTAIVTDAGIDDSICTEIRCRAPDPEYLLVDWLNEIIFEMATRHLVFGRYEVTIRTGEGGYLLDGKAWGERVDRDRHQPAVEPKGATYTALDVHKDQGGRWVARCVVDV